MAPRKIILWLLLSALLITGSASAAAPAEDPNWALIAPGIEFRLYQLPDPNNVFVTRMERNNPEVFLESMVADGKLAEGREPVSSMYERYNQAINFWGADDDPPNWGMRNQAIVAINGSYFDWNTGMPQGGMVQAGWYVRRFDNMGGWGGFAWKLNRDAFISECLTHLPEYQFITFPSTGVTQPITHVNTPRDTNELVLYTPQYNSRTGTPDTGVEVVVEMSRPAMIMPEPAYAAGIVQAIHYPNDGNNWIPFNSVVLSAQGTAGHILLENAQVGQEIRISQEITSMEADCVTPLDLPWTKTYASIQGAFYFLKNGQIREFPDDPGATRRNPRTAIAFNDQYIYFIVVDGRDAYRSIGMTINELGFFTRDTLGAVWGVAQDGGGSSTMVINGQVVNNSYCNQYSCGRNASTTLPIGDRVNNNRHYLTIIENRSDLGRPMERPVANGMMMVVAQPAVYSLAFQAGNPVVAISDTQLRLGPGTNYDSISTIPAGASGTILEQMNGLNGVLAKSVNWWYVSMGGAAGWVQEDALATP